MAYSRLYNLAPIYFRYGRFAGAYGAASRGLDFLREQGRKDYRPQFHRFMAEAHIQNRPYLEAVQEIDTAIRQDIDPQLAAALFARVGDIYFDLNNYELAEDAYGLANRIDHQMQQVNPAQFILRGEALFWLGKFSEAQKMLHYGLGNEGRANARGGGVLDKEFASLAALRIADAYMARKDYEKAKLEYSKVANEYRGSQAGQVAKVRSACLEIPFERWQERQSSCTLEVDHRQGPSRRARGDVCESPPRSEEIGNG